MGEIIKSVDHCGIMLAPRKSYLFNADDVSLLAEMAEVVLLLLKIMNAEDKVFGLEEPSHI